MKNLLTLIIVVLLAVPAALVRAQAGDATKDRDRAQAQGLLRDGNNLLKQGSAAEALQKFTEAYRLFPSPKLHYNLGQAHSVMPGHEAQAYVELTLFLDEAKDASAELRTAAETNRQQLRAKVALVTVVAPEATGGGWEVFVDGASAGRLNDRPVIVGVGTHKLAVQRGPVTFGARAIVVAGGETLEVAFGPPGAMAATPASPSPPPLAAPPPAPGASGELSGPAAGVTGTPSSPAAGSTWQRPTGFVLGALAVASLAFGIVEHVARENRASEFRDAGCGTDDLSLGDNCRARHDSVTSAQTLAIVGYAGAAVLGGASVTLLWLSASPADGATAARASGFTFGVRGRF